MDNKSAVSLKLVHIKSEVSVKKIKITPMDNKSAVQFTWHIQLLKVKQGRAG